MASATIYALEKKPPSPGYPGPIVITIAALTWILIGWQTWVWFHPADQGYTQSQLDGAVALATKSLKDQLEKQIADASAKAQPQSDAPIGVDKIPTSLRLLFKFNADTEELESKNIFGWKILFMWHERKGLLTTQGYPALALLITFKKPIIYKEFRYDVHGSGIAGPTITTNNPRYAIIEFDSIYLNGVVDLLAAK